jgi:hypothetical protein
MSSAKRFFLKSLKVRLTVSREQPRRCAIASCVRTSVARTINHVIGRTAITTHKLREIQTRITVFFDEIQKTFTRDVRESTGMYSLDGDLMRCAS